MLFEFFLADCSVFQQLFTHSQDAIAATGCFFFLLRTVAVCIIALVVPIVTVGHALNERRPLALTRALHGGNRRLPYRDDILTVHIYAGHVVGRGAVGNTWNGQSVLNRR